MGQACYMVRKTYDFFIEIVEWVWFENFVYVFLRSEGFGSFVQCDVKSPAPVFVCWAAWPWEHRVYFQQRKDNLFGIRRHALKKHFQEFVPRLLVRRPLWSLMFKWQLSHQGFSGWQRESGTRSNFPRVEDMSNRWDQGLERVLENGDWPQDAP